MKCSDYFYSCTGASQACLWVLHLPFGLVGTSAFGFGPGNTNTVFYGQSPVGDGLLFYFCMLFVYFLSLYFTYLKW